MNVSYRDEWDGEEVWVPVAPEPFYRPPTFRSLLWAWLRRKPRPEWRASETDPNPNESRWRRG